jgi:hypothetical protein
VSSVESGIRTGPCRQLVVRALLDDPPRVEHDDAGGVADGEQVVGPVTFQSPDRVATRSSHRVRTMPGMANRLTRVPDRPVPPLPRWVRPAIPAADLFMLVMISRPRSGSLGRTWVTPATLQMCVAVVVTCLLCAGLAASRVVQGNRVAIGLGAVLLLLAVGAGAVAAVGIAQRRGHPGG